MSNIKKKAIALISGGLDSALAIRLMLDQGIDVVALHVLNVFDESDCLETSRAFKTAERLGVRLLTAQRGQDYIDMIRAPRYGVGSGVNPCIDCRIHLLGLTRAIMEREQADFLVTGEVVGQRPMSQLKKQIELINRKTGMGDLVVRPLSAKLLEPTLPEREGWIDREKLLDIGGRGRKRQIALAWQMGLDGIPSGGGGCLLTDPIYSQKVLDLYQHKGPLVQDDFMLLTIGRHFRPDDETKLVVGRDEREADKLVALLRPGWLLAEPDEFAGPSVMLDGPITDENRERMLQLVRAYTKPKGIADGQSLTFFWVTEGGKRESSTFTWRPVDVESLDPWRIA
jgi:tRNA U34 2-thiouridine synthase MnmA/TrmU